MGLTFFFIGVVLFHFFFAKFTVWAKPSEDASECFGATPYLGMRQKKRKEKEKKKKRDFQSDGDNLQLASEFSVLSPALPASGGPLVFVGGRVNLATCFARNNAIMTND